MKITDAKVFVCCPGRNFVTLKIDTDAGVYGLGDATLNGRELAVASYLRDHVVPCLIGRDAVADRGHLAIPLPGRLLAPRAGHDDRDRRGRRRRCGTSRPRRSARRSTTCSAARSATASWSTATPTAATIDRRLSRTVGRSIDAQGYKAVRAQCGHPGSSDDATASRSGTRSYEPAQKGLPERAHLVDREISRTSSPSSSTRFARAIRLRRPPAARRASSADADRGGAARQGARAVPPVLDGGRRRPAELQEGFRLIRQHTTTPLAVGEVFNTIWDARLLITEQLIDYSARLSCTRAASPHLRKIAALAELYHVRTGSHGATDLSPVCMGAALHFDLACRTSAIQEYMRHTTRHARRLPARLYVRRRLHASRRRARTRRRLRRGARQQHFPTSAPTCRSTGRSTARCGTGSLSCPVSATDRRGLIRTARLLGTLVAHADTFA